MSFRWMIFGVLASALLGVDANAQVTNVDHSQLSYLDEAGCDCPSKNYFRGQTVWGTYCMENCQPPCRIKPGLFPPCPNPCPPPLVHRLNHLRCTVKTSVSNVFGCLLGCRVCVTCDDIVEPGCGCENCIEVDGPVLGQPMPAAIPETDNDEKGDPFGDDPDASVSMSSADRFRPSTRKNRGIRKASYVHHQKGQVASRESAVDSRSTPPTPLSRRPLRRHYQPQKTLFLKRTSGQQMKTVSGEQRQSIARYRDGR